jgi:hypothetical protein
MYRQSRAKALPYKNKSPFSPFSKGGIKRGIFKEKIKILSYKKRRFYGKNT